NLVQGNVIGTDVTRAVGLGNGGYGVLIDGPAAANTVDGNSISGNFGPGIGITSNAFGNFIQNNSIGIDFTVSVVVGNSGAGVLIDNATGNSVMFNRIAYNGVSGNQPGVAVTGATATGNTIQNNRIYLNLGLGIDLNADGTTPNDPGD